MTNSLAGRLIVRLENELLVFESKMKRLSPSQIYEHAAEICYKNTLILELQRNPNSLLTIPEATLGRLLASDDVLDLMYSSWNTYKRMQVSQPDSQLAADTMLAIRQLPFMNTECQYKKIGCLH